MKKHLLSIAAAMLLLTLSTAAEAQQYLKLVPNPDVGVGYRSGSAILFNNDLYFTYTTASNASQLAQYDGNTITLIANPVSGGVQGSPFIVYNNMMYMEYYNRTAGVYQLAKSDGNTITLIDNPDATNPTFSFSAVYNNKLCIQYNAQLALYDGTSWTLLAAPVSGGFTFQGGMTVYNNKLYMGYQTNPPTNIRQELQFDGTTISLITNPDAATAFSPFGGGYQGLPIIYGNDLYTKYVDINANSQLNQYDGTTETLISNPEGATSGYGDGSAGSPIVYNNDLYIQYYNSAGQNQLGQYNGTALTLITNPDTGISASGYQGAPIVYDDSLYIQYQDASSVYRLAKYNGTSLSLITNPDASTHGYANYTSTGASITPPILYGVVNPVLGTKYNLYIQYEDVQGNNRLAQYNDTALSLVINPDTSKTSQNGYSGSPIVFNDSLYVQYLNAAGQFQLAYLVDSPSSLPVTLLNFTAQKKGNKNLLQWQTASEINSSYFAVERSSDNINFTTLGNETAKGNTASATAYSFTDNKPNDGTNYYRLHIVNKDGTASYSPIRTINDAIAFTANIYPNPVKGNLTLNFNSGETMNAQVEIINNEGKIMLTTQMQLSEGLSTQTLNTASLSSGTYYVRCITAEGETEMKFVKAD